MSRRSEHVSKRVIYFENKVAELTPKRNQAFVRKTNSLKFDNVSDALRAKSASESDKSDEKRNTLPHGRITEQMKIFERMSSFTNGRCFEKSKTEDDDSQDDAEITKKTIEQRRARRSALKANIFSKSEIRDPRPTGDKTKVSEQVNKLEKISNRSGGFSNIADKDKRSKLNNNTSAKADKKITSRFFITGDRCSKSLSASEEKIVFSNRDVGSSSRAPSETNKATRATKKTTDSTKKQANEENSQAKPKLVKAGTVSVLRKFWKSSDSLENAKKEVVTERYRRKISSDLSEKEFDSDRYLRYLKTTPFKSSGDKKQSTSEKLVRRPSGSKDDILIFSFDDDLGIDSGNASIIVHNNQTTLCETDKLIGDNMEIIETNSIHQTTTEALTLTPPDHKETKHDDQPADEPPDPNEAEAENSSRKPSFSNLGDIQELLEEKENAHIVEAYNHPDNELVIAYFDIKRKTVKVNEDFNLKMYLKFEDSNGAKDKDQVMRGKQDDSDSKTVDDNKSDNVSVSLSFTTSENSDGSSRKSVDLSDNKETDKPLSEDEASCKLISEVDSGDKESSRESQKEKDEEDKLDHSSESGNSTNRSSRSSQNIEDPANEGQSPDVLVRKKIKNVVEELLNSHDTYIRNLEKVIRDYIPFVEQLSQEKNFLVGRGPYLFGNIAKIYEKTCLLSLELKGCEGDLDRIFEIFLKHETLFNLYPLYSKNKPKADQYLKEFAPFLKERQDELKDQLDLSSYLLCPIQRLGKDILLLEKLSKEMKKLEMDITKIGEVLQLLKGQMRKGNDFIAIDSIIRPKDCHLTLHDYGSFIIREKFLLHKPKRMESMVFLFENVVIFTYIDQKNLEKFIYWNHLKIDDLSMTPLEVEEKMFYLKDYNKSKKLKRDIEFVLEAPTSSVKKKWISEIQTRLWEQLKKCKNTLAQRYNLDAKLFPLQTNGEKTSEQVTKKKTEKSCDSGRTENSTKQSPKSKEA